MWEHDFSQRRREIVGVLIGSAEPVGGNEWWLLAQKQVLDVLLCILLHAGWWHFGPSGQVIRKGGMNETARTQVEGMSRFIWVWWSGQLGSVL